MLPQQWGESICSVGEEKSVLEQNHVPSAGHRGRCKVFLCPWWCPGKFYMPQALKLDTGEDSTGSEQPQWMYSPMNPSWEKGLFSPPSNRQRGHYTMSLPKQHNSPFPHPLIQLAHRPVRWGEGLALNPSCAFCFLFLPCSQRSIRKAL